MAQRLSREVILEAAQTLLEEVGRDGLSMRALGRALGVEAMALYHYVPNKDALLDALVESFTASIEVPLDGEVGWEEMTRVVARSFRAAATQSPNAAQLLLVRPPTETARGPEQAIVARLVEQGFGLDAARKAYRAMSAYAWGTLVEDGRAADRSQRDVEFEFGLDVLVTGLREVARPRLIG